MFILIKYTDYEEQIPISSIIKFAKNYKPEKYEITLSEIFTTRNTIWNYGMISNKIIEITKESQPKAFSQIQNYLETQIKQN
jgi:hypothetical protein